MSLRAKRLVRKRIEQSGRHSVRVFLSNKHTYAQIVSPEGVAITGLSTRSPQMVALGLKSGSNKEAALHLGKFLGEKIVSLGLGDKIAYDRSGKIYHGRVKAIADGARQVDGIKF